MNRTNTRKKKYIVYESFSPNSNSVSRQNIHNIDENDLKKIIKRFSSPKFTKTKKNKKTKKSKSKSKTKSKN